MAPSKCFWLLHKLYKGVPIITRPQLIGSWPIIEGWDYNEMSGKHENQISVVRQTHATPRCPSRPIVIACQSVLCPKPNSKFFIVLPLTWSQLHPTGEHFFHNWAGILIRSCCASIMAYHQLCMWLTCLQRYWKETSLGKWKSFPRSIFLSWHHHSLAHCEHFSLSS